MTHSGPYIENDFIKVDLFERYNGQIGSFYQQLQGLLVSHSSDRIPQTDSNQILIDGQRFLIFHMHEQIGAFHLILNFTIAHN